VGTKRRLERKGFTFHKAFFLGSDDRLLVVADEASAGGVVYVFDVTRAAPAPTRRCR